MGYSVMRKIRSEVPWYRWPYDVWQTLLAESKKELPEQPKLSAGEELPEELGAAIYST